VAARLTHKPRTNLTKLTYWHPNGITTDTCHIIVQRRSSNQRLQSRWTGRYTLTELDQ